MNRLHDDGIDAAGIGDGRAIRRSVEFPARPDRSARADDASPDGAAPPLPAPPDGPAPPAPVADAIAAPEPEEPEDPTAPDDAVVLDERLVSDPLGEPPVPAAGPFSSRAECGSPEHPMVAAASAKRSDSMWSRRIGERTYGST